MPGFGGGLKLMYCIEKKVVNLSSPQWQPIRSVMRDNADGLVFLMGAVLNPWHVKDFF